MELAVYITADRHWAFLARVSFNLNQGTSSAIMKNRNRNNIPLAERSTLPAILLLPANETRLVNTDVP